jgi:serine/threonine protein phosphatase PrpC
MKFQAAARAFIGSKETQEDARRVHDAKGGDAGEIAGSDTGVALTGGGLILVADGIGGHYGGDVASRVTADTFVKEFFAQGGNPEGRLKSALTAANDAIAEEQRKQPSLKDMGATLVTGFIEGDRLAFLSIGDSLILRYRDGELHRVNVDHSYLEIADREALGSNDRDIWRDVMSRKGRDSITIAVLGRPLEEFGHAPQIATRKIMPGDLMIFSSDGLETLSMVQIQNFIRELLPRGIEAVADGLIKAVEGIGGNRSYQDNATLVVVQAADEPAARTTVGAAATPAPAVAEAAKTAPVTPKTAPLPPKQPAAEAAPPVPETPPQPQGAISSSARTGKWSPAKLVFGIAVGLLLVGAAALGYGLIGSFRSAPTTATTPNVVPPAPPAVQAPAPTGETGLKQLPPPASEDSEDRPRRQSPAFQPKGSSPSPELAPPPRQILPNDFPPPRGFGGRTRDDRAPELYSRRYADADRAGSQHLAATRAPIEICE